MEIIKSATPKDQEIKNLIYEVRSKQVMLDSDLAKLYGVDTSALNRAVKRNEKRFPEDFRFKLTRQETVDLRCQFGILAGQDTGSSIGRTYLPYAYTEQGVAMLAGILRSDTAIEVSIHIVRAFVEMRHFIASNKAMFEQIRSVELRQLEYEKSTNERFARVFDFMDTQNELLQPAQKVFFNGEIFDAFEFLVKLIKRAKREIILIDNYVDIDTLNILAKKTRGVKVVIYTRPKTKLTNKDIETFNAQYPTLAVEHENDFHDRFLFLDGQIGYLIGASLKDAGKKSFAIAKLEDETIIHSILERIEQSCK